MCFESNELFTYNKCYLISNKVLSRDSPATGEHEQRPEEQEVEEGAGDCGGERQGVVGVHAGPGDLGPLGRGERRERDLHRCGGHEEHLEEGHPLPPHGQGPQRVLHQQDGPDGGGERVDRREGEQAADEVLAVGVHQGDVGPDVVRRGRVDTVENEEVVRDVPCDVDVSKRNKLI